MYRNEIEFTLPLGYQDTETGAFYRSGKMRQATAIDEITIQEHEKVAFNQRYRDLLVLSLVITQLGEITQITPELLENLYEVDFIYLQMLYREVNSSRERKAEARCPACGNVDEIKMADLFKDMNFYYSGEEVQKGEVK